jgi:hypothetical protein
MRNDPIITRIVSALQAVPGVAAIVLGGSRSRHGERGLRP